MQHTANDFARETVLHKIAFNLERKQSAEALLKAIAVGQRLNNRSFTSKTWQWFIVWIYFLFQFNNIPQSIGGMRIQSTKKGREKGSSTELSSL